MIDMETVDYSYNKNITDNAGSFICDAAEELRSYIGTPKSMILPIILPIMSIVIGTKASTFSGSMDKLRVNLWTIIIGDSGVSGKSTTLQILKKMILGKLEEKIRDDYVSEKKIYNLLDYNEKQKTDTPKPRNIYSGQGSTFEGMIKNLSLNTHGLLAVYDEGSEFLNKMLNDKKNKASFTSLYAQDSYGKDLVGKDGEGEQIWIDNPFVSLILVSNPHWFHNDTRNSDFVSGFLNRFSIYQMNDAIEMKPFSNSNKHSFEKFQTVAIKIWDYLSEMDKSFEMELSKEAKEKYQVWYIENDFNITYSQGEDAEYLSFLVRQKTAVLKYAMIIQIFDSFYEGKESLSHEIELKYLDIGIAIAQETMMQIENLLEHRQEMQNKIKYDSFTSSISEISSKVMKYLSKFGIDQEHPISHSVLIRQVRGLTKGNISEVMRDIVWGVASITKKSKNGKETTYYYKLEDKDCWL